MGTKATYLLLLNIQLGDLLFSSQRIATAIPNGHYRTVPYTLRYYVCGSGILKDLLHHLYNVHYGKIKVSQILSMLGRKDYWSNLQMFELLCSLTGGQAIMEILQMYRKQFFTASVFGHKSSFFVLLGVLQLLLLRSVV